MIVRKEIRELIVAICEYLPYELTLDIEVIDKGIHSLDLVNYDNFGTYIRLMRDEEDKFKIKPRLRKINSLTEEEIEEFLETLYEEDLISVSGIKIKKDCIEVKIEPIIGDTYTAIVWFNDMVKSLKALDWLNSKKIDYRGLIERGLALELH